ncbi:hypothetical protein HYU09_01275 [Candidatus Woesearchaeota archaeon]|nr:hypothetical protein [Candidatus Woesearchaeota archaeon]
MPFALRLEDRVISTAPLQDDVPHGTPLLVLPEYLGLFGLFDENPVHFSDEAAREFGFDGRIAHGMLGVAAAAADISKILGPWQRISEIYVKFRKPVYPGETLVPSHTINEEGDFGLKMLIDGEIVIEGHAKTKSIFPSPFDILGFPAFDFDTFNSRVFLGNTGISPGTLKPGDRHIKLYDQVSLANTGNYDTDDHLITGMSAIEPLLHISGLLGNYFPGNGTIYLSQKGRLIRGVPGFMGVYQREILVDVEVLKAEAKPSGIIYTMRTRAFDVYNRMNPLWTIMQAFPTFDGTAEVMVKYQAKPTIH